MTTQSEDSGDAKEPIETLVNTGDAGYMLLILAGSLETEDAPHALSLSLPLVPILYCI